MISINRKAVRAAGGTQSDELAAKIKSVTSATTVGAVFVYDTRNDSDGGAWRKKTQGLSWFDEDLNTATRGGRREFPSVALIVADNATDETLKVYDLDDPSMPVWMVFNVGGSYPAQYMLGETAWGNINTVTALNGRIYLGRASGGLVEIDFVNDYANRVSTAGQHRYGSIANRNADSGDYIRDTSIVLVNIVVNAVAATYLEGGELDSLGLVRPVVACATNGGVSVIHPNGDVYDDTYQVATSKEAGAVGFNSTGGYWYASRLTSGEYQYFINRHNLIYADTSSSTGTEMYRAGASAAGTPSLSLLGGASTRQTAWADTKNTYAIGSTSGLSLIKYNTGNPSEGAVCDITSDYNTGYMLGDIRLALAETRTTPLYSTNQVVDRSVKSNTISIAGTITNTAVATNAELSAYSGFSASNYLSRAYDADFDFGTGDFSVMFWCKLADTVNATETVLERAYGGNALFNIDFASGVPRLIAYNGSAFDTTTGTRDLSDNQWHQLMCFRKNGVAYIYIDGKQHVSNAMTYDLDNSQAILHIGQTTGNGNPLTNGSLSLLRISATAPTPTQVADIYRQEAPLFRSGAKCLLSQVSFNDVNDLAYDNSSDLLYVGTKSGDAGDSVSTFRGLERVDTKDGQDLGWDGASANLVAAAGGVVGYARTGGTGGLVLDLPAIDVRGDINTADSKLPDDGKIRFTGVTTDATVTTIGQIPVAEGETYMVRAVISGNQYQDQDGERILATVERTFYRDIGGNIAARSDTLKLTDETTGSLNAVLGYASPPPHNILIKVTGKAGTRMQWNAEVEVQRISEKQYER